MSHKKNNSEEETKRVEQLILDTAKQLAQQKNVASECEGDGSDKKMSSVFERMIM